MYLYFTINNYANKKNIVDIFEQNEYEAQYAELAKRACKKQKRYDQKNGTKIRVYR